MQAIEWIVTAVGVLLVALVVNDIFHTLFHPQGQGRLGTRAIRLVWSVSRRFPPDSGVARLTGPLAMMTVIGTWALLVVVGWAMVYWPHLSGGFHFATGLGPEQRSDALDALYMSLVAVTTLGIGDIMPTSGAMRIAVPLEAMMGFILLTAAVSWVLQVYPAISRSRSLSRWLATLRGTASAEDLISMDSSRTASLITGIAQRLVEVHVDLEQYSETYYYRSGSKTSSLSATIGYAQQIADAADRSAHPDIRWAGRVLDNALDGLALSLTRFLRPQDSTPEMLDAYAADHGYHPDSSAHPGSSA